MDKYLWAVRVFKTRSDAADAVRTNKVTVNGAYAKPSREVKIGDVIAVRKMQVTYSYKVLDLVSSRQPAKNVPLYCLNVTPQEELDKLNVPRETIFIVRDRGTGRPDQEGAARTGRADGGDLLRRGGIKGESRQERNPVFFLKNLKRKRRHPAGFFFQRNPAGPRKTKGRRRIPASEAFGGPCTTRKQHTPFRGCCICCA